MFDHQFNIITITDSTVYTGTHLDLIGVPRFLTSHLEVDIQDEVHAKLLVLMQESGCSFSTSTMPALQERIQTIINY